MNRFASSGCFALFAGLASLGCTAGDDVYIESHTGTSQSSLTCVLTAGEDVCSRKYGDLHVLIGPADQEAVIGLMSNVAELAGVTRDGRDELAVACATLVDKLGGTPLTFAPDVAANTRATALCDAAVAIIASVHRSTFSFTVSGGTCMPSIPAPSCAPKNAAERTGCSATAVTLTMNAGASPREVLEGTTLQKSLAVVVNEKSRLQRVVEISGLPDSGLDTRTRMGHGAGTDACVHAATSLLAQGIEDAQTMATLVKKLSDAIAP